MSKSRARRWKRPGSIEEKVRIDTVIVMVWPIERTPVQAYPDDAAQSWARQLLDLQPVRFAVTGFFVSAPDQSGPPYERAPIGQSPDLVLTFG